MPITLRAGNIAASRRVPGCMNVRTQLLVTSLATIVGHGCSATTPAASSAPVATPADSQPATAPAAASAGAPVSAPDWPAYFGDQTGCFAMLTTPGDTWVMNDEPRCRQAFHPFSTFKITNALIGLETGAVADADTVIEWDPTVYPAEDWWPEGWRQRNDLRSAYQRSALPYFRALATRIGANEMNRHVTAFGYGNADTSGGLDEFWLTGGLRISAVQQIEFLRALHEGRLPVSERARRIVEDIMIHARADSYVLRAKTGTGMNQPEHALGWFVGFVERAGRVHYFALNRSGQKFADIPRAGTIAMAERILADLGALPAQP